MFESRDFAAVVPASGGRTIWTGLRRTRVFEGRFQLVYGEYGLFSVRVAHMLPQFIAYSFKRV